jgi:hypothetical protein
MHNRMRLHVRLLSILAILFSALSSGCTHEFTPFFIGSGYRPPHVPELDRYVINLESIQRTSSQEDVRAILGEPPFVHETYGDGDLQSTTWRYPIRDIAVVPLPAGAKAQRRMISAAELRIWFDKSGEVDKWGFFHPIKSSFMEIRESVEEADSRLRKVCKPPKRIDLARLLRQGTPREDVLKGMHWFEGLVSTGLERSQVRILREGQQEILIYYADHPSPLYVPPYYVEVTFYAKGDVGTGWHFVGWGGCK